MNGFLKAVILLSKANTQVTVTFLPGPVRNSFTKVTVTYTYTIP